MEYWSDEKECGGETRGNGVAPGKGWGFRIDDKEVRLKLAK